MEILIACGGLGCRIRWLRLSVLWRVLCLLRQPDTYRAYGLLQGVAALKADGRWLLKSSVQFSDVYHTLSQEIAGGFFGEYREGLASWRGSSEIASGTAPGFSVVGGADKGEEPSSLHSSRSVSYSYFHSELSGSASVVAQRWRGNN